MIISILWQLAPLLLLLLQVQEMLLAAPSHELRPRTSAFHIAGDIAVQLDPVGVKLDSLLPIKLSRHVPTIEVQGIDIPVHDVVH